ncbi:MAG: hypothetical protein J6X85_08525, partial [Ruminococcus sp.]|nr:hypothetical protein [Ruminococcus sp.]
ALLERDDFDNRAELTASFNEKMETPEDSECPVIIAMGVAEYIDGQDENFHDVFVRADKLMYERKRELKTRNKSGAPR